MNLTFRILFLLILTMVFGRALAITPSERCREACQRQDWEALNECSQEYYNGVDSTNIDERAESLFYLGISQLYGKCQVEKARKSLMNCYRLSTNAENDSLSALALNSLGLLEGFFAGNYSIGQSYFLNSLERSKRAGFQRLCSTIYGNLSELAMLQADTTGLRWAKMAYSLAKELDVRHTMANGAYCLSAQKRLKGNFSEALHHLEIADSINKIEPCINPQKIDALYASIYTDMGNITLAHTYIRKVLEEGNSPDVFSEIETLYNKARVLAMEGSHAEACQFAKNALTTGKRLDIHCYDLPLYQLLAEISIDRGDLLEAIKWLERRNSATQSHVANMDSFLVRERQFAFDLLRAQQEKERNEIAIRDQRRLIIVISGAAFLLLLALLWIVRSYHRRMGLYKTIVGQHRQSIQREEQLRLQLEMDKTPSTTLNEDKAKELWLRLCKLLDEDRLYADPQLNREMLAERLKTNRTYLSQIIKEIGHTTLSQLIRERRLRQAQNLLSSTDIAISTIWQEVGFSSEVAFSRAFRESLGMTPIQYRNASLQIKG